MVTTKLLDRPAPPDSFDGATLGSSVLKGGEPETLYHAADLSTVQTFEVASEQELRKVIQQTEIDLLDNVEEAAERAIRDYTPGSKNSELFKSGIREMINIADQHFDDTGELLQTVMGLERRIFGQESRNWSDTYAACLSAQVDQQVVDQITDAVNSLFLNFAGKVKAISRSAQQKEDLDGLYGEALTLRYEIFNPFIARLGGRGPCPDIRDGLKPFDKDLKVALRELDIYQGVS